MKIDKIIILAAMAFGSSAVVHAADNGSGTVTFTGAIVDAPCSISSTTSNQTVRLGNISDVELKTKEKSTPVDFQIQLQGCDFGENGATKNRVTTTFTGTAVSASGSGANLLSLGSNFSGAGVGINSLNGTTTPVVLGTPTSAVTLTGENPVLKFEAFVQRTGASTAAITPGSFSTVANFQVGYN